MVPVNVMFVYLSIPGILYAQREKKDAALFLLDYMF